MRGDPPKMAPRGPETLPWLVLLLCMGLWSQGDSAGAGLQPAHRAQINVAESHADRDGLPLHHPSPNNAQRYQHQPGAAAAARQPAGYPQEQHQHQHQPVAPGRQRSGEDAFQSEHGALAHGDGAMGRGYGRGPLQGQSRDDNNHLQTGRGQPPLSPLSSSNREAVPGSRKPHSKATQQKTLELVYKQQVERKQQQQEEERRQRAKARLQQQNPHQQEAVHETDQLQRFSEQNDKRRQQTNNGARAAAHGGYDVKDDDRDTRRQGYKSAPPAPNRFGGIDTMGGGGRGGGGGVVFRNDIRDSNNNNNNNDEVPDAPHGANNNKNNNNNNNDDTVHENGHRRNLTVGGLSEEFKRGLMPKVYKQEEGNQPMQRGGGNNAFPPEQPLRKLGGMGVSWDWDDFSISFQNYGVSEMKVRRAPHATTGEPWPLPQYYTTRNKNIMVLEPSFDFLITNNITCDIMEKGMERYKRRILENAMEDMYDNLQNAEGTNLEAPEDKYRTNLYKSAPRLSRFSLKIRRPCSLFPSVESDESYDLVVKKASAYLWATEVWGLLRGLETLSQLVWRGPDNRLYVKETVISDYPRFAHRGILIDSSRHFIFKEVLFDMMDGMEMNKMNVLHWHLVDDQSFPYQSKVFPELSAKGAYHPTFVYSIADIAEIIEYARLRGIRILPEFDSPGHTYSWGLSRPELLTQCYSGSSPVKGYLGPIDPVRNSTYRFLKTLFQEILHVFQDDYLHLGGDEVPLGCWQSNPEVVKFGKVLNKEDPNGPDSEPQGYYGEASPRIRLVYEYYVNRLMKDIKALGQQKRNGVKFIMWQEVMNNDLKLPNDTLIQVWIGDMADVSRAIGLGYDVLYSTCWYLDHVEYGVKWPKYYQCDPADDSFGYRIDEKKVKGGEACLWSEYIDNENLIQTTWPRASAVAERLWSSKDTKNLDSAGERLSEHRCRMLKRGLSVGQISGPDYCLRSGVSKGRQRRSSPDKKCQGADCDSKDGGGDGDGAAAAADVAAAADPVETHSDIKFRVRTEGGGSADCSWMGSSLTVFCFLLLLIFIVLISLTRSSGKFYVVRLCRHRTILLVFLAVLFVYFMCYTTMWMHVFEFSGSFQRKIHAS